MSEFNYYKDMEKYFDEVRGYEFLMSLGPGELIKLIEQAILQLKHRNALIIEINRTSPKAFALETLSEDKDSQDFVEKVFEEGEERSKDLVWARLLEAVDKWEEHLNPKNAMYFFPLCFMYESLLEVMKALLESGEAANWTELNIAMNWGIKKWESDEANIHSEKFNDATNPVVKKYLWEKEIIRIFDGVREVNNPYLERRLELRRINRRMAYLESRKKIGNVGAEVIELMMQCNYAYMEYIEELCNSKGSFFGGGAVKVKLREYNQLVEDVYSLIDEKWLPALEEVKSFDDYASDEFREHYDKMEKKITGFGDMIANLEAEGSVTENAIDEIKKEKIKTGILMAVSALASVANVTSSSEPKKYVDAGGKEYDAHQVDSYGHVREEYL